jgi:acetyl esterase/lipase
MDGGPGFPFLSMAASGLDAAYPELDLDSYLNEAGRTDLSESSSQCLGKLLFSYAGKNISDCTTVNPLTTEAWQARIAEQQLGGTAPVAPVFLGHGRQDELIPCSQAEQLKQDWCSAGASVTWEDYLGEHIITLTTMRHDALGFLADRFSGRPVTSSC